MTRAASISFWFGLAIITSIGLYRTSDHVQALNRQMEEITNATDATQKNIHVLKAEWGYLSQPSRIAGLTKRHLSLRPTTPQQIATLDSVRDLLPTRPEALAAVAVTTPPIANIHTTRIASASEAAAATQLPRPTAKAQLAAAIAADRDHLVNRMMIRKTATLATQADPIGLLIGQLELIR